MKPALIAPRWSVYIASDGSIGEIVCPISRHWIKWTAIRMVSVISEAARQMPVRDRGAGGRGPATVAKIGNSTDRPADKSWRSQPLFINCIQTAREIRVTSYYTQLD
jgi:hypothetical protein